MEHNTMESMGGSSCKDHWCMHSPVRVLTAVIVLVFVFWCGFEFGSMHEYARGGFEGGYGYGPGMMGGWNYTTNGQVQGVRAYQGQAAPATGAAASGATTAVPAGK